MIHSKNYFTLNNSLYARKNIMTINKKVPKIWNILEKISLQSNWYRLLLPWIYKELKKLVFPFWGSKSPLILKWLLRGAHWIKSVKIVNSDPKKTHTSYFADTSFGHDFSKVTKYLKKGNVLNVFSKCFNFWMIFYYFILKNKYSTNSNLWKSQ